MKHNKIDYVRKVFPDAKWEYFSVLDFYYLLKWDVRSCMELSPKYLVPLSSVDVSVNVDTYLIVGWSGSRRHPRGEVVFVLKVKDADDLEDVEVHDIKGGDFDEARFREVLEEAYTLWKKASKVVPEPPASFTSVNITVRTRRAGDVVEALFVDLEFVPPSVNRYAEDVLKVFRSRSGRMLIAYTSFPTIVSILSQLGFKSSDRGGYTLPISGELSSQVLDTLVQMLEQNKMRIAEDVFRKARAMLENEYREVAEARRTLGVDIPPSQPIVLPKPANTAVAPTTAEEKQTLRPVAIKGFLVVSKLPSKALLDANLPEIFKDIKIGTKQIKLVMGYFYNKLGTLSRKFYCQILPNYAVDAGFGYIVPKERVPAFLRDVDLFKREYEDFEQQLKDFLLHGKVPPEVEANKRAKVHREYLNIVTEYLREHGVEKRVKERIESLKIANRVRVNLLPFSIDYSIIQDFVDEKIRERVSREIKEIATEITESARRRIEEKVRAILERVEKLGAERLTQQNIDVLKAELEGIIKEAEEFGISTEPLRRLSTALENPEEFAKAAMEVKASSERLKALIKSMA